MSNNDEFVLHWFPGTCARVVLIALEEIGVPFESKVFRRFEPESVAAYRRDINPKGKVPALYVDGKLRTEIPAIQVYLNERFPEAGLLPSDHDGFLAALTTLCWFSGGIHPEVGRSRIPGYFTDDPDAYDGIRAKALEQLRYSFSQLETRLEGREWLFDQWTITDGYMLWLWFRGVGSGISPDEFPNVHRVASSCQERPSVARALDREEVAFAELESEGKMPPPAPHQAGRIPIRA